MQEYHATDVSKLGILQGGIIFSQNEKNELIGNIKTLVKHKKYKDVYNNVLNSCEHYRKHGDLPPSSMFNSRSGIAWKGISRKECKENADFQAKGQGGDEMKNKNIISKETKLMDYFRFFKGITFQDTIIYKRLQSDIYRK